MQSSFRGHQGDVFFMRVPDDMAPPASELEPVTDPRGLVLAEGETSGHYHALFGHGAKLMRFRATGEMLITVGKSGAMVRVVGGEVRGTPRHLPVHLAPGKYISRVQRQWTSEDEARSRRVED
jgi:hypothetical protein